jgi:preprotein translocase subunit SecA
VDIILGGNPPEQSEGKKVRDVGGLFIVGTERHEARRIDNQLRGRGGRQGDPGVTQFFISTEDDLARIFVGDAMKKLMEMLKVPEDMPIESGMVSKRIEEAQTKIEGSHFDVRKHLLDYDSVLNKQREVIYKKRDDILEKTDEEFRNYILDLAQKGNAQEQYQKREEESGKEAMLQAGRFIALRTIDFFWQEHLELMDSVRDSVRLRAYGQQDPLVEYKSEANKQFHVLLDTVEANILQNLLNVSVNKNAVAAASRPQAQNSLARYGKVDRNAPCPCGAKIADGRPVKYKHCHGK